MNLRDRLARRTPCGYGGRYYFEYRKEGCFSIAELIRVVCERWALRNGALSKNKALALYQALAKKYCHENGYMGTYQSLENGIRSYEKNDLIHPKSAHDKARDTLQIKYMVDDETAKSTLAFCFLDGIGKIRCKICDAPLWFDMQVPSCEGVRKAYVNRLYKSSVQICRAKLCRFVADEYPKIARSKGPFPLAVVLHEAIKKGKVSDKLGKLFDVVT